MKNKVKLGVYAGSFSPFHVGHLDILYQARRVFDEMIIAIGKNPEKEGNNTEPFPENHPAMKGVSVKYYDGLLSDYLSSIELNNESTVDVTLVRGLRNGDDLQYEQNQLQFIKEMYPSLKTVFFICDKKFEHISSSALRALKKVSIDEYKKYIFEPVPLPEKEKYGSNTTDKCKNYTYFGCKDY